MQTSRLREAFLSLPIVAGFLFAILSHETLLGNPYRRSKGDGFGFCVFVLGEGQHRRTGMIGLVPLIGKMLVACEESGTVRDAFAKKGWDAWSADLGPSRTVGQHYQGDVREILSLHWDLIIAHPPCTYICNSGNQWIRTRCPERWPELVKAVEFFNLFLTHPCEHIAIENPVPYKLPASMLLRSFDQKIQPYMFGHPESKATCLWLKGLPPLRETNNVKHIYDSLPKAVAQRIHYMGGKDRQKERSKTFPGIASAMAEQWTEHILNARQVEVVGEKIAQG